MSPVLTLRRSRQEPDVVDEQLDEELPPPVATGVDQVVSTWSTRLATVGLFTCLALGPIGTAGAAYAILLNQQTSGPVAVAEPVVDRSDERATVAEFAQRVVTVWLTSTQENPDALQALVKDAAVVTLSKVPFEVSDVDVAGIARDDAGTWSVQVAATVTDASEETARRYYQVPVRVDDAGALSALTLPAPVAAPVVVGGSTGAYRTHLAMNSPVADTVTQFLSAYIAGTGDVSRYVTPGSTILPVTPPPYSTITLAELRSVAQLEETEDGAAPADGETAQVLATASAVVSEEQVAAVTYALSLTARAGRWEITAIDPAPVVSEDSGAVVAPDGEPSSGEPSTDATGEVSPAPTP
ncbi:conjugal transfer protein [Cellulosimicrobium cellulans]|uniref:conjugal transfer protein n=1 Tax=Cellulosimicrobium cellulans TaxID=1710 RepID=UPI0002F53C81|nr:conjugal transfer protein [Cellulosimicrobium cellulans]